ncbi:Scr1 family TA system antitoxin-like transcriptional regulator [Streptomyces sp. NPDC059783]|uniref:DUF397 domain-containing protein n=1 Tax=Streptomyces sp. NPDC059783 TaxID=3346944 RepID=UPI0036629CD0
MDEAVALARRSREPGWVQRAGLARPSYTDFIDYERTADYVRSFQNSVVAGLLQTPDYARAVLSVPPCTLGQDEEDALVTARMRSPGRIASCDGRDFRKGRRGMSTRRFERAAWRTSSYSGQGGDCVEVADGVAGLVPVRDSKAVHGPVLAFSTVSWRPFVEAVKRDDFVG